MTTTNATISTKEDDLLLLKYKTEFTHYAPRILKIKSTNPGDPLKNFRLNEAQKYIHEKLEEQRKKKGYVRALVVKGRQQGISTYVAGRYFWKATLNRSINCFILCDRGDTATSLLGMTTRFYDNLPDEFRPEDKSNSKSELSFRHLDSGYKIGSANSPDVGRGTTITHFHGSEVAYWDNGAEILAGIFQSVPDTKGTEVILESTAKGPHGVFYDLAKKAGEGLNDFQVIFVPWFWEKRYKRKIEGEFVLTKDEEEYKATHNLTDEQMAWRRNKINTLARGLMQFRQEYPATLEEAFADTSSDAPLWDHDIIQGVQNVDYVNKVCATYERIACVVAYDPAGEKAGKDNDASGIIVAELREDGICYVLEDASGKYKPHEAIAKILHLYRKYQADRVTVEVNGVGNWVPAVIEQEDPSVVVYRVNARQGKNIRAQPVANKYRQGMVKHRRYKTPLSDLEDELCTWVPFSNMKSPNRLDALVYAITDLCDIDTKAKKHTPIMWARQ